MYQPFVTQRLVKRGYPALHARKLVEDRSQQAREELAIETKTRPVTINRAPSLHKFNLIAAYPRLIPGKTIKVNPFIEDGMNLDYDGDALQVHLPASRGAVKDSERMLLSNNLLSEQARGKVLVLPKHEAVAGLEKALTSKASKKPKRVFKTTKDALAAYRRGEITLADTVEVKDA
jgi:DNA-directed RNA polymerase subunit beta'